MLRPLKRDTSYSTSSEPKRPSAAVITRREVNFFVDEKKSKTPSSTPSLYQVNYYYNSVDGTRLIQSGYTSCFGEDLGKRIGAEWQKAGIQHRVLGGDIYDFVEHGATKEKALFDKFPDAVDIIWMRKYSNLELSKINDGFVLSEIKRENHPRLLETQEDDDDDFSIIDTTKTIRCTKISDRMHDDSITIKIPATLYDQLTKLKSGKIARDTATKEKLVNDLLTAIAKAQPAYRKVVYTSIDIGNHDRGIEGSSTGSEKHVDRLEAEFGITDEKTLAGKHSHFIVGPKKAPWVETFIDESKKNGILPFHILHIDSNILPFNQPYINQVITLLTELHKTRCHIVISMHHAPDAFGSRRSKKGDAQKYLGHLVTFGYITKETEQAIIEQIEADHAEWTKEKEGPSPWSWNQQVANTMSYIYAQAHCQIGAENCYVLASTSGHEHFAFTAVIKNQPLAFVNGNGAQEGIRVLSDNQLENKQAATTALAHSQLIGVDPSKDTAHAPHSRLGAGVWEISNTPQYMQWRFPHQGNKLVLSTRTVFQLDDGNKLTCTINDYVNNDELQLTGIYYTKHYRNEFIGDAGKLNDVRGPIANELFQATRDKGWRAIAALTRNPWLRKLGNSQLSSNELVKECRSEIVSICQLQMNQAISAVNELLVKQKEFIKTKSNSVVSTSEISGIETLLQSIEGLVNSKQGKGREEKVSDLATEFKTVHQTLNKTITSLQTSIERHNHLNHLWAKNGFRKSS